MSKTRRAATRRATTRRAATRRATAGRTNRKRNGRAIRPRVHKRVSRKRTTVKRRPSRRPVHRPLAARRVTSTCARALTLDAWMNEARRNRMLLTWTQVQAMKPGQWADIAIALEQSSGPTRVIKASDFFRTNRTLGVEAQTEAHFYEHQGLAVTGSGADHAMLWSNVLKMPCIRPTVRRRALRRFA